MISFFFVFFFQQGLIQALVEFNLHEGTPQMRSDVRHLLCLLTKDNEHATVQLNEILIGAVAEAVNSHKSNPAVVSKTSLFVKHTVQRSFVNKCELSLRSSESY